MRRIRAGSRPPRRPRRGRASHPRVAHIVTYYVTFCSGVQRGRAEGGSGQQGAMALSIRRRSGAGWRPPQAGPRESQPPASCSHCHVLRDILLERAAGDATGLGGGALRTARRRVSFETRRKVAGWTGLEPATSCVTGRRSNQLSYHPVVGRRLLSGWEKQSQARTRQNLRRIARVRRQPEALPVNTHWLHTGLGALLDFTDWRHAENASFADIYAVALRRNRRSFPVTLRWRHTGTGSDARRCSLVSQRQRKVCPSIRLGVTSDWEVLPVNARWLCAGSGTLGDRMRPRAATGRPPEAIRRLRCATRLVRPGSRNDLRASCLVRNPRRRGGRVPSCPL
jgi:hypothetical protein